MLMERTETESGAAADADDRSDDDVARLTRSVEALLFMSGASLSLDDLCELTGEAPEQVNAALDLLRQDCERRAVHIASVAGGFQLVTRREYGELVAKLLQPKRFRLSRAALETLAIVAYKQPATRPEVEEIRGVNVDGVMETLLQHELVRECGRRRSPGRPIQYATTENFLTHFGLNSLQDLPDLDRLGRQDEVETEEDDAETEPAEAEADEPGSETEQHDAQTTEVMGETAEDDGAADDRKAPTEQGSAPEGKASEPVEANTGGGEEQAAEPRDETPLSDPQAS